MLALGSFWKKFVDLLPQTPRQAGQVSSLLGDKRYLVTVTGGGVVEARSEVDYVVGTRVFIVGHSIEGLAPDLPTAVIEV